MRDIRFRAWDKHTGHWVEDITLILHTSGKLIRHPPNVDLQQFTGLLDKNGKEIYEGDIVSAIYTAFGKVEKDTPFVVVFGWRIFADSNYEEHCIGYNLNPEIRYEVIGNIYENPELLT